MGVTPATLRRWAQAGVIPEVDGGGGWTAGGGRPRPHRRPAARARPHGSSRSARRASRGGSPTATSRSCSPDRAHGARCKEAATETGLEPAADRALLDRASGCPPTGLERAHRRGRRGAALRRLGARGRLPARRVPPALRVYGQALAQIADAEVRLFHLYVHEPLMREGVPGLQMAEEMEGLARDLLPLASPLMDYMHQRYLQHFVEQDVVGHMETELEGEDSDARARARGDRLRRPRRLHPLHRGGGRGGGAVARSSASSRACRTRCPRTRASSRRSATR